MSSPATEGRVIVALSPQNLEQIDARAPVWRGGPGRSKATDAALTRYFLIIDQARAAMEGDFTDAEVRFIGAICNGSFIDAAFLEGLALEIEDADEDAATSFGVDVSSLVLRVGRLPLAHRVALVDLGEIRRRESSGK